MRKFISHAMDDSDELVVEFDDTYAKGARTHRVVGPIQFLGLCLSREEPRLFCLERRQDVRLAMAADFLMPVRREVNSS